MKKLIIAIAALSLAACAQKKENREAWKDANDKSGIRNTMGDSAAAVSDQGSTAPTVQDSAR